MSTRSTDRSLRIPAALQREFEQICDLTDAFCAEHLDAEYGELARKLVAKLARKRPSPIARGHVRIWAGAAIYAVGSVNFLFDRTQHPHTTADELSALIGVPKRTLAAKAKSIRDALHIGTFDPEFCRRGILASNPMAWMVSVNAFIVDARTMPPEVQAEAHRRGLIPDLQLQVGLEPPAAGTEEASNGGAPAMGISEAVNEVIGILRVAVALPGSPSADGWDRIVRTVAADGSLPDGLVKGIERAIEKAYHSWSDVQRRSVWHETDSGMADDDEDDATCDTSFNGIGYALQIEMLDEVTRAAWRDADELKKAAAKMG